MRFIREACTFLGTRIRFDRNELSGAFGDIGTVLPLLVGVILSTGIDGARVFVVFGLMQMVTAVSYGIPMPVQPLKAAALIVITQQVSGKVYFGGGFAIGITMLVLSVTGIINSIARIIPKSTVRGIQLALGLQLVFLSVTRYIPSDYIRGSMLAGTGVVIMLYFMGNRKLPPALAVVLLGAIYVFFTGYGNEIPLRAANRFGAGDFIPRLADIVAGFVLLAIPQVPLSLGNSIYATSQLSRDYFSEQRTSPRKISLTYSFMNILSPFLGGIPVCHGSGGMAGHYLFGARTGGSVFICGTMFVMAGLMLGENFTSIVYLFPLPILGVILLFEGMSLVILTRDMIYDTPGFVLSLMVGAIAVFLPYGYLAGMIAGITVHHSLKLKSPCLGDSVSS